MNSVSRIRYPRCDPMSASPRSLARSLAPRQTTNEWSVVGRKEEGERGRARARSARAGSSRGLDGRDGPTRFLFFVIRKRAQASELIALIVSQEKVGLGTSYSDTLRKKRGMWFSGATKLGPWPLKERSTSEQHCIGVIKLRVKGNNFAGIGSAK